jgi:hypothetical protein
MAMVEASEPKMPAVEAMGPTPAKGHAAAVKTASMEAASMKSSGVESATVKSASAEVRAASAEMSAASTKVSAASTVASAATVAAAARHRGRGRHGGGKQRRRNHACDVFSRHSQTLHLIRSRGLRFGTRVSDPTAAAAVMTHNGIGAGVRVATALCA